MEKRNPKDWPTFVMGEAFRKAARLYHLAFPETTVVESTTRRCPDCGKGRVEPKKQYCAKCRLRRRKATDATNHRNWRKEAAQRHTKEQNGSSLVADSRGPTRKSAVIHQESPKSGAQLYYASGSEKGVSS
jgi:hypothetical protein